MALYDTFCASNLQLSRGNRYHRLSASQMCCSSLIYKAGGNNLKDSLWLFLLGPALANSLCLFLSALQRG